MSRVPAASTDNAEDNAMALRRALGSFATGVTIITTRAADGQPLGLTVNSFNSVSLNPPLVLWSLANSSRSHEAFRNADHWAVHVLATDQEELSGRFARSGSDKFAGLELDAGIGGLPLLRGCSARFQCRAAFQYEGGDHLIFVGEVMAFDWTGSAPLVFHGGRYAHAVRPETIDAAVEAAGDVVVDPRPSLIALVRRAGSAVTQRLAPMLARERLSSAEFEQLAVHAGHAAEDVTSSASASALAADAGTTATLLDRHLLRRTHGPAAGLELTEAGAACLARLMSAFGEIEAGWREQLGVADAATLARLLAAVAGASATPG